MKTRGETIADLHIHSRYARACSKQLTFENIAKWADIKGIDLVGTGDFTHPAWFANIRDELVEEGDGVFALKKGTSKSRFILTSEISSIYKQGDKVRRIHLCVFLPSVAAVQRLIDALVARGANLAADGRPIVGIPAPEIVKMVLDADPRGLVVPAHAWTPWFAVFGSKSGFDSLEECFGETTKYIYAIETGLSSDPPMNWRLSQLDSVFLISNSDAHSLRNLGREANVFAVDNLDYQGLYNILKTHDHEKFSYTIEFFPEEGMYHFDGHRACKVRLSPSETKRANGICPSCKKPLTVGVMNRVDAIADRTEGFVPKNAVPFKSIVPLEIVIGDAIGKNRGTKSVDALYEKLTRELGSEFQILLHLPYEILSSVAPKEIVEAIKRVREGKLEIEPGYDGVYGSVRIMSEAERTRAKQSTLAL